MVEDDQSTEQGEKGGTVGGAQHTDKKKKVGDNANKETAEDTSSKKEEGKSKPVKDSSAQPVNDSAKKEIAQDTSSKGEEDKSKSNNPAQSVIDSAKKLNTDSVIDGAKKLKGLFGF